MSKMMRNEQKVIKHLLGYEPWTLDSGRCSFTGPGPLLKFHFSVSVCLSIKHHHVGEYVCQIKCISTLRYNEFMSSSACHLCFRGLHSWDGECTASAPEVTAPHITNFWSCPLGLVSSRQNSPWWHSSGPFLESESQGASFLLILEEPESHFEESAECIILGLGRFPELESQGVGFMLI